MPAIAEKIDFYKTKKPEYVKPKRPALVKVGPAKYLAIDGKGRPGGELFSAQLGALYGAAYTVKMTRKSAGAGDFKVCALEGLYWCDCAKDFSATPPKNLKWRLLIRVPADVTPRELAAAVTALKKKGKDAETANLRLEKLNEGKCVQMLHVGPYSDEAASVAEMQEFTAREGLALNGLHHEIYLSDPRRVPPERLQTILRQPVK